MSPALQNFPSSLFNSLHKEIAATCALALGHHDALGLALVEIHHLYPFHHDTCGLTNERNQTHHAHMHRCCHSRESCIKKKKKPPPPFTYSNSQTCRKLLFVVTYVSTSEAENSLKREGGAWHIMESWLHWGSVVLLHTQLARSYLRGFFY